MTMKFIVTLLYFCTNLANADVEFTVNADRDELARDETVQLTLKVRQFNEKSNDEPSAPTYSTPEFKLVQQWKNENVQTTIVNGEMNHAYETVYSEILE